ncbi:hypothetical protein B9W62_29050 [Streptomyces sp. CS113]|uniref:hypothetical protein n=1 Tax=Streptomyces sp. CS113 TaxID=1982761 RepID=UPI000B417360|nr:hypothetical protein [Streptomyces sp. CS113]OWA04264.1 hypothetical protein B9W62_29050 [Streptomyces sp. CS113]
MGRGGALRRGRTPRRGRAALTLVTAVVVVGCGSGDGAGGSAGSAHGASASAAPSASRQPLSGAELCVSAVGYWAREMLDGGEPYGDYQSMGLSNRQYDILREVVDEARAAQRDQGARTARELLDRRVRQACADGYRDGGPSRGPWQS